MNYELPFKISWYNLFILAAGSLFLMIPALYNSYPLVTSDSGAYINNGWVIHMPHDRPIGYSLFIRISSLNSLTLWGVVIFQAVIGALLMQLIMRSVLGIRYHDFHFLGIALLTGVATSAGWFAGQIMPDIFTAYLLLALCILFFIPVVRKGWRWGLYLFIALCAFVHTSNLLISLLLGAVLFVYALIRKRSDLFRPASILLIISIVGWVVVSSMHAIAGRGFRLSSASHVFIMSRMVENGILDSYLHKYCDTEAYELCSWRGKFPDRQWDFMWSDSGPFIQTGGWAESEKEYNKIIRGSLADPRFLGMHIVKNSLATIRQLPLIYVGDGLMPFNEPSNPFWKVQQYFGDELKEYRSSLQQTGMLRFEYFNILIVLFSLFSIVATLIAGGVRYMGDESTVFFRRIFKLVALFLICNAAITATFSTVIGRFQSRVFWVLVFFCVLYLLNVWLNRRMVKNGL